MALNEGAEGVRLNEILDALFVLEELGKGALPREEDVKRKVMRSLRAITIPHYCSEDEESLKQCLRLGGLTEEHSNHDKTRRRQRHPPVALLAQSSSPSEARKFFLRLESRLHQIDLSVSTTLGSDHGCVCTI